MLRPGWLLTIALLCLFVPPVAAIDLIAPLSQDRSVTAYALAVNNAIPETAQDSDSLAAPDTGPFDSSATASATIATAAASSSASQTSEIFAASIQASGTMSATADSYDYEAHGLADASSHCEVTFAVVGPSSFTLSGNLTAAGTGAASVTLDGPAGTIASVSAVANQTTQVLEAGELGPETYTLTVSATGSAFVDFFVSFDASASYDLLFELAPATGVPDAGGGSLTSLKAVPNPFREACTIECRTPGVGVSIFDVQGRLVRKLPGIDGTRVHLWDGRNGAGELIRPGVYFVRLAEANVARHLKVIRIR